MLDFLKRIFGVEPAPTKLYRIKVILPCEIEGDILKFNRENEIDFTVEAEDKMKAVQKAVTTCFMPCPHVCIDTVEEVSSELGS